MNTEKIYKEAYRLLENTTPLKVDCGRLCGGICCDDGGIEDAGMYLYYKEEVMFKNPSFPVRIEKSAFEYGGYDKKALILMCEGKCSRAERPLSCRIFPLIPYKKENESLKIIIDPRAKSMCPLAKTFTLSDFDEKFLSRTRLIFKVLSHNKYINDFIIEQSYLLDEVAELESKFKK